MLGRLEMGVDECIAAYIKLMKMIYEKQVKSNRLRSLARLSRDSTPASLRVRSTKSSQPVGLIRPIVLMIMLNGAVGCEFEHRKNMLGPEHPNTLMSINNLGIVLDSQGKYEEADIMRRQVLRDTEKMLRPENPDTHQYQQSRLSPFQEGHI